MEEIELPKTTVFIDNLPASTTESDLKEIIQQSGQDYIDAFIQYDFAIVEFDSHDNAKNSIEKLNGMQFKNQRIIVEWARRPKNQWLHRSPVRSEYIEAIKNKFTLKVRNLSDSVTWQELDDHFVKGSGSKVNFTDVYMIRQQKLGYVEFETKNDVELVLKFFDNTKLKGEKILLINFAELDNYKRDSHRNTNRRVRYYTRRIKRVCSCSPYSEECSDSDACYRARRRRRGYTRAPMTPIRYLYQTKRRSPSPYSDSSSSSDLSEHKDTRKRRRHRNPSPYSDSSSSCSSSDPRKYCGC